MIPAHKPVVLHVLCAATFAVLFSIGCGGLTRDNPVDPFVTGGASLSEQLIGTWTRQSGAQAQDFVFSIGQGVVRVDYTDVSGGTVDRLGSWPTTRVHTFQGVYELVGNELTMTFNDANSNDPSENLMPPAASQVVNITIRRNTLTTEEAGSILQFVHLQP